MGPISLISPISPIGAVGPERPEGARSPESGVQRTEDGGRRTGSPIPIPLKGEEDI